MESLPMVAISYEQAATYCQWKETIMNSPNRPYVFQYSLPTKAGYEMTIKKAKITQNKTLSPMKSKNCIFGLTDNVTEYTQDGMIVEGGENTALKFVNTENIDTPIGCRCKSIAIEKK
jgi:hypothetical protein